jgi:hypothetical protein
VESPPSPELNVLTPERLGREREIAKIARSYNAYDPLGPGGQQLTPVKWVRRSYAENEVKFFIVYGPHGYGKSAYLAKCLAQLNGTWEWEKLKKFIVWKPTMLCDVIEYVEKSGHDEFMLGCDDAGVWLNAMKWNHPLLMALTEYFDVIRIHFHGIMFTSPLPLHVIKRIRGLPQSVNIRIDKIEGGGGIEKLRHATGYTQYILPDLKRTRVKTQFIDTFSAIMPEKFYTDYYKARKGYTSEAYAHVKDELKKWKSLKLH